MDCCVDRRETETLTPPKYIVLSGGGINGFCFCGALIALEKKIDVSALKGCIGTSVGALIGLAICLGIRPSEIRNIVQNADWEKVHPGINVHSLTERFGIDTRSSLEYLAELVITEAGLHPKVTLQSAYSLTKRHFCACVCDLTHSRVRYLDHITSPTLSVRDAVVASMCVPILFEPVTIDGCLCVDGGLVENLPVHFFDVEQSWIFHFRNPGARSIRDWQEYVMSVLNCGHRAKEDMDLQEAAKKGGTFFRIDIPQYLPSGLELKRVNAALAQHMLTIGYMQTVDNKDDIRELVGSMVQLVCVVHSSMQELP